MKVGIIGGGIVGKTTAHYLTKEGMEVVLFDDDKGQATKASAGIISPWLSQRRNQNWYNLARMGAKLYPSLIAELDEQAALSYQQVGTLMFKKNPKTLDKTLAIGTKRLLESPEIGNVKKVTPEEINALYPELTTNEEAVFLSGGARVDGKSLLESLTRTIQQQGGTIKNERVSSIVRKNDQWLVSTNNEQETFDYIVLAVGPWLSELLTPLGFEVDVRPQKGQLLVFHHENTRSKLPVVIPTGEGDIIPIGDDKLLIGATHENEQDFDLTVDISATQEMFNNLHHYLPDVSMDDLKEVRVGTRAYTSDFLPFFGFIPHTTQLLVASGLGSSGLTTGPMIGKMLAQLITKQPTELDATNYSPDPYITPLH
ncbi:NAD(P)/FAD-dependent oxidoreductase [Vagococcus xieshaowenii]|uniref:FAD-binding oxidoreductase n=1 Tax=Vagococcus xieshaowenii TaxID=2562451 RepID=A0AAJ5EGK6_9ENTE|nr:FAD-dependent oxidoreductase [Vagococcus xieshaowenii]QCA28342.1 FAD-binding oxidoreductase [Vagococcus xieshaowenii]TFZ42270.1 FAD-binding oxidoreductase [Vagococcus xieshaowenii]